MRRLAVIALILCLVVGAPAVATFVQTYWAFLTYAPVSGGKLWIDANGNGNDGQSGYELDYYTKVTGADSMTVQVGAGFGLVQSGNPAVLLQWIGASGGPNTLYYRGSTTFHPFTGDFGFVFDPAQFPQTVAGKQTVP